MIHLLVGAFLILSQPSFANSDLAPVDEFLRDDTFDTAFQPGVLTVIDTKSCIGSFCDAPYGTHFSIEDVTQDEAAILRKKPDGTQVSQEKVSRSRWNEANQNRVRIEIKSLESAGFRVTVLSILPSSATVIVNDIPKTVQTRVVELQSISGAGTTIRTTLAVAPGLGGMGQLVSKTIRRSMGADTFSVTRISGI